MKKDAKKAAPKKGSKRRQKLYPIMLPKSALEALDKLCVMRRIDPEKEDRRSCAIMALILEAIMVETTANLSRSLEKQAKEARERRRKEMLAKLN